MWNCQTVENYPTDCSFFAVSAFDSGSSSSRLTGWPFCSLCPTLSFSCCCNFCCSLSLPAYVQQLHLYRNGGTTTNYSQGENEQTKRRAEVQWAFQDRQRPCLEQVLLTCRRTKKTTKQARYGTQLYNYKLVAPVAYEAALLEAREPVGHCDPQSSPPPCSHLLSERLVPLYRALLASAFQHQAATALSCGPA